MYIIIIYIIRLEYIILRGIVSESNRLVRNESLKNTLFYCWKRGESNALYNIYRLRIIKISYCFIYNMSARVCSINIICYGNNDSAKDNEQIIGT